MTIFDSIRYPITDICKRQDLALLPDEIIVPWLIGITTGVDAADIHLGLLLLRNYQDKMWTNFILQCLSHTTWNVYQPAVGEDGLSIYINRQHHYRNILKQMIADHDNI